MRGEETQMGDRNCGRRGRETRRGERIKLKNCPRIQGKLDNLNITFHVPSRC